MFLDVCFEGYEVFVDEGGSFFVAVRLGFQPSTSASGGRGAEIDQHGFLLFFRFGKRAVSVFSPMYFHLCFPPSPFISESRMRDVQGIKDDKLQMP